MLLFYSHSVNHPAIAPRIEKHAVGIAVMHLENLGINLFAGLLSHAYSACLGVVEAEVVYPIVHEQAVGLTCSLVGEKLVLEVFLARSDLKRPPRSNLEVGADFHDFAIV